MITGNATADGTALLAKKHGSLPAGHWRSAMGLTLSSVGLGTYLGNADPITDGKYTAAALQVLGAGINVLDTAANYRYQRSERNLGAALKQAVDQGGVAREQVVVCTKAGYIPGDWGPPTKEWFEATYVKPGILKPGDVVGGGHVMTPAYLRHAVDQSRANLGLATIDLYYVHNPEAQLEARGVSEYYARLTDAFRALEECAAEGKIAAYGTATWNAYRAPAGTPSAASLERTLACAREAGGERHRFRAVQLPYNLGLPEAAFAQTQERGDGLATALELARDAGLAVFTSASLMQGQLLGRFSPALRARFTGLQSDAQRCLQFARSTPGVTTALCGMKTPEHVAENLRMLATAPLGPEEFDALVQALR